jgi:hypothetical protein
MSVVKVRIIASFRGFDDAITVGVARKDAPQLKSLVESADQAQ